MQVQVQMMGRHTVENGSRQVALKLAASRSGGWSVWVGVLPLLEEVFGLLKDNLRSRRGEETSQQERRRIVMESRSMTHPLLSGVANVLVCFEEGADVEGLAAPEVSVDRPVEGELQ